MHDTSKHAAEHHHSPPQGFLGRTYSASTTK